MGEVAGATGIARATITSTLSKLVAGGTLERVELPAGTHGYRLAKATGRTAPPGRTNSDGPR